MECPHTFLDPHTLAPIDPDDASERFACPLCHGRLRICEECPEPNRLTARFCTRCGQRLETTLGMVEKLLAPGALKDAISRATRYPLDPCLKLDEQDAILCWVKTQEGAVVITRNRSSDDLPHRAFLVPGYRFDSGRGIELTEGIRLSNYKSWIEEPLVTQQGVFIVCSDVLHYFASHGGESIFRHRVWRPDQNERILAIGAFEDGFPYLLIRTVERRLAIAKGNTQSGQWGKERVQFEIEGGSGGYLLVKDDLEKDRYRLFTGTELIELDKHREEGFTRISFNANEYATFPDTVVERIRFGFFTPFVIRPDGVHVKCVAPLRRRGSNKADVAIIPLASSSGPSFIDEKTVYWVLPDAHGQGAMIGSESGVKRFVTRGEPSWSNVGGRVERQPILRQNWLAIQADRRGAPFQRSTDPAGSIIFASISRHQDQLSIGDTTTALLPGIGESVAGAPPLYSGGSIYIALENQDHRGITVYTAPITE